MTEGARRGLPQFSDALLACCLVLTIAGGSAPSTEAATLQRWTIQAWDQYTRTVDERVKRETADKERFLIRDRLSPNDRNAYTHQISSGGAYIAGRSEVPGVRDGEIHHYWGAVLVPNINLAGLLARLQDYDHHAGIFADVESSKLLSRDGETFRFSFRLKRTKALLTAHYHTEQECTYRNNGPDRGSSRSFATKIAEIADAGTPRERELPPGQDRGFLWRLMSWWRFQQTAGGVIVECESASLSRDVPAVVKLVPPVASYIRSTPKESLESVLLTIRGFGRPGN